MTRLGPLLALGLVAGCDIAVRIDPEGYRCDQGACPTGFSCLDDVCRRGGGDRCAGVSCTNPPAPGCFTSALYRTWAGRCEVASGTCVYDPVDTSCAGGCVANACANLCVNKTCTTPDPPFCVDASTLTTFALPGVCNPATGLCGYAQSNVTCTNGCVSARCVGQDLCLGVTCTMPPPPECANANTMRTYAATGTCDSGTGRCSYAPTDATCPGLCVAGNCVPPSLAFAQVGPRVRFAINGLDNALGSSGDNVVAVGNGGQVARWNGFTWTTVAGPSTQNLNAVAFVNTSTAFIVGANRTAWAYRTGTGSLAALAGVPGSGSANLVSVYGRGDTNVLIADDSGGWLKLGAASAWTNGSFPGADGPYQMKSAYIDESLRERVGGLCGPASGRASCVLYRNPSSATVWTADTDSDSQGISAVGASFDVVTSGGGDALVGKPNRDLLRHASSSGAFTRQATTPTLEGGGIVGITGIAATTGSRGVYVLTSSSAFGNGLFRLTRQPSGTVVPEGPLVETYFGKETLSPNEATGVMVAETKSVAGVNNIFRRSTLVNDALDLGEDFTGVTTDGALGLVLVSSFGDVAIRRVAANTFSFFRGPYVMVQAAEGKGGTGVLVVGQDGSSTDGYLERFLAGTFTRINASAPNTRFNSVCRVSDTEAYAVGSGGAIFVIAGVNATRMSSNVTADLHSVDCPSTGSAVVCGANGTVLRLTGNTWTPAPSPGSMSLASCRLVGNAVFAAGDAFFGRLDPGATGWSSLAPRGALRHLVVRAPNEVYAVAANGTSSSDIIRFDGSGWASLLNVTEALGGGVQIGARVVFGGTDGAIVEGR